MRKTREESLRNYHVHEELANREALDPIAKTYKEADFGLKLSIPTMIFSYHAMGCLGVGSFSWKYSSSCSGVTWRRSFIRNHASTKIWVTSVVLKW